MKPPIRIGFLLPHFRPGGAERVVLNWLLALDRTRFAPVLLLGRIEGDFLAKLPPDVPAQAIGGSRALARPLHIARALAAHRIDIAYSATSAMNLALLAAPTRIPRIISEHTPPQAYLAEAKWSGLRRLAIRALYPRATWIAAPTQAIADAVAAMARTPRVAIIPNPVISGTNPSPNTPTPGTCLVSAGRLVAAKGFDTLIEACAILQRRGIAFDLAIHGEGPLRPALAQQIAAHGLVDRVTLAGHADPLAPVLAAADLFVLASRREGFGNVLVEAMAAGTPVLATRAGGPETFLRDGHNGFLVEPGDPSALADAIAALLANPARRAAVRDAAFATAGDYTIEASTRRFEALVEAALAR